MLAMKRLVLLALGVVCSAFMVWLLYQSIQGTLWKDIFVPVLAPQEPAQITLPMMVSGTTLLAERISSYEGPFLEDKSDREVVNIAALHIYNAGDYEVLNACITLQMEEGDYVFYGEHFPPGERVLLLEMRAQTYKVSTIIDCSGWQITSNQTQQDGVRITDKDNGTLIVTNTTNQPMYDLHLYYKSWLSPPDIYVGGVTHSIAIPALLPGQTQMLCPDRYATGYSKVVSIITYP